MGGKGGPVLTAGLAKKAWNQRRTMVIGDVGNS